LIIALIGNDGSGKTTTSRELAKIFREIGFETIYKHEYDYVFLKYLFKLTGRRKVEQSRKEMLEQKKKGLKFQAWPVLVWLDTFAQFAYYKIFKRNSVVILDRYPYDHYMSFEFLGYLTKFTKWLYLHFPKADATILLWVEPEIAYSRKKDTHTYAVSFYAQQTQKYLSLAGQLGLMNVNTNRDIGSSLTDIFDILYTREKCRVRIKKRALENKTYSDTLSEKIGGKFANSVIDVFESRKDQFKRTMTFLRDILGSLDIKDYAVFKDYGSTHWIGNDIDIIVNPDDFHKLCKHLERSEHQIIGHRIDWKLSKSHSLSVDVRPEGLLNIDVHTAIGWRGLDLISLEQLKNHVIKKQKFGLEYLSVASEVDALIYACSHVFEKGFLVSLEHKILQENVSSLEALAIRHGFLKPYVEFLANSKANQNYPLFIPLSIIASVFSSIRESYSDNGGLTSFLRIVPIQLFWRARYALTGKLPFRIQQYGE
jgi:thymidylate kinase